MEGGSPLPPPGTVLWVSAVGRCAWGGKGGVALLALACPMVCGARAAAAPEPCGVSARCVPSPRGRCGAGGGVGVLTP